MTNFRRKKYILKYEKRRKIRENFNEKKGKLS